MRCHWGLSNKNIMTPLPQAGGVGGGHPTPMERLFKPRNTKRAKELRHQASPAEIRLWQHVSNSQLDGYKFSRQIPIGPYYADFVCRMEKLVVELDGFSHEVRVDYDRVRTKFIEAQGYRVIRFNNEDVMTNLEGVLIMIRQALTSSSLPTPTPWSLSDRSGGPIPPRLEGRD